MFAAAVLQEVDNNLVEVGDIPEGDTLVVDTLVADTLAVDILVAGTLVADTLAEGTLVVEDSWDHMEEVLRKKCSNEITSYSGICV